MTANNIILFPVKYRKNEKMSEEEFYLRLEAAEEDADNWIDWLNNALDESDLYNEDMGFFKDSYHTSECLRALVFRSHGIPHPFHMFADNSINLVYDDAMDVINASWKEDLFVEEMLDEEDNS